MQINNAISIHSLRGEGDMWGTGTINRYNSFQSTPSVGRETHISSRRENYTVGFQSTPSVGRETFKRLSSGDSTEFQSTPSVGRETRHSGRDTPQVLTFQSTPSVGRETPE